MHASARSDDDDASQAARAAFHHWTLWQAMSDWLGDLLLHPRAHTDFPSDMDACADTLIRLTDEEPDVAIFHMVHARIDKVNRYSVLHAMHCAMLLTLIGRHRKWDEARTATAVKAGLTMNLSITALQNQLAQQTTPLTREQHDAIEAHPAASTQMLRELGVRDEAWLTAVLQHHEEAHGKGYPQHIDEVDTLAQAIHTCDVFGAKISPRIGRVGMPPPAAAQAIFQQLGASHFGITVIHLLGTYPPGCLVELASGERGVVVRRHADPCAPQVVLIGQGLGVLPLATLRRAETTPGSGHQITGVAADQYWSEHIPPEAILRAV